MDAVSGAAARDAAEVLDVKVDELARGAAVRSAWVVGRLEPRQLPSPTRNRTAETAESAIADSAGPAQQVLGEAGDHGPGAVGVEVAEGKCASAW